MNIAIGGDHRGFHLKQQLVTYNHAAGYDIHWIDVGSYSAERCDYPPYAVAVVDELLSGRAERGVMLCGSGVGMSIVANRFVGIYAALVWNEEVARQSHEDDKSNILVLPADYVSIEKARTMIAVWLGATFKGGRFEERIAQIDALPALAKK